MIRDGVMAPGASYSRLAGQIASTFSYRMLLMLCCLLSSMSTPLSANDSDVSNTFQRFGLTGIWSANCTVLPLASSQNLVEMFGESRNGQAVTAVYVSKDWISTENILQARILNPNQIELHGGSAKTIQRWSIMNKRRDGRIQVEEARQINGIVIILNRKILATHRETGTLEKCQAGDAVTNVVAPAARAVGLRLGVSEGVIK